MSKAKNSTGSGLVTVTLSEESVRLLDELAERGIYGKNKAEVAARFIDRALQEFAETPRFKLQKRRHQKPE